MARNSKIGRRKAIIGIVGGGLTLAEILAGGFIYKAFTQSLENEGDKKEPLSEDPVRYTLVETYNLQPVRVSSPEEPALYDLVNNASNRLFNDCGEHSRGHKDNEGRCIYDSLEDAQKEANFLSRLYTERMKEEWDNCRRDELRERFSAVMEKLNKIGLEEVKKRKGEIHCEIMEKYLRSPVYRLKPVPVNP